MEILFKMKNVLFSFVILFGFIIGCEQEKARNWTVKLIKPDGAIYQIYTVTSIRRPNISPYGGFTIVYDGNANTGIYAPAGWLIMVEKE